MQSKTDMLTVLQNRIMRILFSCKRTNDAWNSVTDNNILTIKQLYNIEIAKLCYKHHTKSLPVPMNSAMPHLYDPEKDKKTKSMTAHNYKNTVKQNKTLSRNCISIWNNLSLEIKNTAYTYNLSTIHPTTNMKRFTDLVKASVTGNR